MALLKTNTGIGTTNPTSALHVIGDGLFTGIVTAASFSGPINAGVGTFTNLTATNATLTNINSSGISTLGVTSVTRLTAQSINSSGIVTGSTFRPSTGYIQAADGTNSFYIYDTTGNVAFQGTIGASQINNAQGYKVIGFAGTDSATFENNVYISGITTSVGGFVGNLTGTATTATKLENARTFEITGDVVATAISFDGTGNVSLAATIQPNSVGLGTDTFGDYVRDITGTANEIEVTGGTGEGSTPQIGLPDDVVITNNLYVGGITTSVGGFVGALTGIAASATKLVTPRTFEITGDVVATAISFDGTGNVSLAATIQPNSVGLGTDTTGDYVRDITGTSNQITVTGGTGEGSTPTLSFPNQVTIPQDLTVIRDVQIDRNLNVTGNITVGGTSGILFTETLKVTDSDLVLGFRTDAFGNDVSNDTTANHGGIAVASTEGNPLVNLNIAGIETLPPTYKKIMWFKAGEFAGLGTDAWLFNYAVGIGSTQFPLGTRLAAGAVQFTENDLAVVRNINASGIITAASFSGNASSATNADYINISSETSNDSTYYIPFESGIGYTSLYVDTALTYNPGQDLLGLTNIQGTKISLYEGINASGVITATTFNGQVNAGVGTIISLIGTNLDYSGVSTLGSVSATQLNVSGIITGTLANDLILNTSGTGLSGSVTYNNSGVTTFTVTSNATDVNTPNTIVARDASGNFNAGIINANLVGIASTATQLLTPRDFSITGDFVTASAISFDGTGNVALAATITPNSIELGTYTSGNYVASITNGDYITGGDGGTEGAALTIGVAATSANTANQVVARDESGNFSAGTITANLTGTATTASFATTSYYLTDAENILNGTINPSRLTGTYDIDINGNATTADYADVAGIATYATSAGIASYADVAGISTYATLAGIASYADVSGISTYADVAGISTYSSLAGIASYADVAGIATYAILSGISSYADVAGIATYAISAGIASYADVAGISTYSSLAGIASYADVAGISTNVIGGIASVTQLSVSGVSTISVNSSSDALRITQEGSGNALVVEDSTNPDATPFVVNAAGSVGIGTTNPVSPLNVIGNRAIVTETLPSGITLQNGILLIGITTARNLGGFTPPLQIEGLVASESRIALTQISSNTPATGGHINLGRARGTVIGSNDSVQNGDSLGFISFNAADGTDLVSRGASIEARIDGNVGVNSTPAALIFSTTNSGEQAPSERVRITSTGSVGIGTTNPTSRLQVQGDTFISGILTAVNGIRGIGIQSGGVNITTGIITTLNFIGSAVSTITNTSGLVEINVKASQFTRTSSSFTATEGQTTFSVSYTPNYVDVFINGVRLTSSEYTATNGSTIVLNDAAFAGDIIDVIAMQNDGLVDTSKWTATNTSNPISGNIYKESGNVGIGTTNPTAKLHVVGDGKIVGVVTATSFVGDGSLLTGIIAQGSGVQIKDDGTLVGTAATFNFINNINATVSSGVAEISISYVDNAGISTDVIGGIGSITQLSVSGITTTATLNVGTGGTVITTTAGGLVGIGTTNPTSLLQVQGNTLITGIATVNSNLFVNGNTLVADATNNRVGIGTTNPVTPLHISDGNGGVNSALYTSDYLTISAQNTSPGFNIIAAGSDPLDRGVFKATRARGTLSSPTVPLAGDATFSLLGAIYDGSTSRATAAVNMEVDGGVGVGTAPQRITFWTGTGSSRLERVRITGSGNVGIGTTNPTNKLEVYGDIGVGTSHNYRLSLQNSNAYNIGFNSTSALIWGLQTSGGITTTLTITGWGDGNAYIDNRNNGDIYFRNTGSLLSNSTSLVFKSGGTLLIGSATSTGTASQTLQVHSGGAYFSGPTGVGATLPFIESSTGTFTISGSGASKLYFEDTGYEATGAGVGQFVYDNGNLSWLVGSRNGSTTTGSNELFRVLEGGNIGIGTTNPQAKLHVIGDVLFNNTTAQGSVTSTGSTTVAIGIHSGLSTSTYRSVEYTIQATQGTNYHSTKILALHDGTTAYHSEYGTIYNNISVATYDVDVSGGNIRLLATGASASSTNYVVNFVATKI